METDAPQSNSNPLPPSSSSSPRKRNQSIQTPNRWKTPKQQQMYSSNLVSALRRLPSRPTTGRAVRAAADRALAAAARGRSRWSLAILSDRRVPPRIRKPRVDRPKKRNRARNFDRSATKKSSKEIERKVKVLGRLVPGCERLRTDSILEEAEDYIAALGVQVRAMSVLADLLTGGLPTNQG